MPKAAKKPVSEKTRSLLDAMNDDKSQSAPEDKLDRVRDKVRECRDLELENERMAATMKENSDKINRMKQQELVDLFDEVGVTSIGLEPEGNLPAYEIEVRPYYHANINMTEPSAPKALEYLRKRGDGDMIKSTYTVSFGMGEEKRQKSFEDLLKKNKIDYDSKFGVPWNTLTAWLRRMVEVEKKTPPLALLGATVGRRADVKKPKKQKGTI